MANYHCDFKVFNRSGCSSIMRRVAYRSGGIFRDEMSGEVFDYRRRAGVLHTEIMPPINAPAWVYDRALLWKAVDVIEKRHDAQLAREVMIALPNELTHEQRVKLVRSFISQNFIKLGMIADFAIHAPSKKGDDRNYHAHILLTMRSISSEGFGLKMRDWNAKRHIYAWRKSWEIVTNAALEQAGFECRIDCRSLADRGLDREPLLHLGYEAIAKERQGVETELGNKNREIEARNALKSMSLIEISLTDDQLRRSDLLEVQGMSSKSTTTQNSMGSNTPAKDAKNRENGLHNLSSPRSWIDHLAQRDLSLVEGNDLLTQLANEFDQRAVAIKSLLTHAPDEKTRDRLQLQSSLEQALFTKTYNKLRENLLHQEDSQKNVNEIAACRFRARKADNEFTKCCSEWNLRAVHDMSYIPTEQHLENKVLELKALANSKHNELLIRAEKMGWSDERIHRETKSLQKSLDHEIARSLGLSLGLDRQISLGR